MKKKILILALAILIITVGAVVYFAIQQKKDEGLKEDKHEYFLTSKSSKLESIDIESIIEYEDHYVLGVHYPVTENEEINKIINEFVQEHINKFKADAKEFFEGSPPPGGFSSWKYELNIDYNVNRPSKDFVCFKFNINIFTGGGGIQFIETFSFNLETGKELTLKDVFEEKSDYLNLISELSIKQLTEKLFDSGKVEKTPFAEDWVKDGADPTEENFRNFSLKDNSIIFYFEKYQVVAGAFGQQQVEIPFDHLREVLKIEITRNQIESEKPAEVILPEKPLNVEVGGAKIIALTFDDGPHPKNTPLILEELKKRNAVATFFVVGNRVQYYPEVLAQIIAEGNEIGNHTWSHKQLTTLSPEGIKKQVNDTQEAVKAAVGITPKIFRTPYGEISDLITQNVGLPIILWSVDTEDWKNKDSEVIVAHIITETDNGEIVLQHDLYLWSVEAVGPALDDLISKGYKFVTVSQLLGFIDNPTDAIPGEVFRFR
jgi:peptidoglycan/xylan/chitin deacetylase (PgdA/CDA1 family)